jgi:hypothetical protein
MIGMKSSTSLTLMFSILLVVLFAGTLLMPAASATIVAKSVDFEPKDLDLNDPEEIVTATIRFSAAHGEDQRVVEINTSTVRLEGSLSPIPGSNRTGDKPPEYICDFDGYSVRDIMWLKIYHNGMAPNPQGNYVVDLTITGNLYDGTSFTGTGHIQVKPHKGHSPPPPPPP